MRGRIKDAASRFKIPDFVKRNLFRLRLKNPVLERRERLEWNLDRLLAANIGPRDAIDYIVSNRDSFAHHLGNDDHFNEVLSGIFSTLDESPEEYNHYAGQAAASATGTTVSHGAPGSSVGRVMPQEWRDKGRPQLIRDAAKLIQAAENGSKLERTGLAVLYTLLEKQIHTHPEDAAKLIIDLARNANEGNTQGGPVQQAAIRSGIALVRSGLLDDVRGEAKFAEKLSRIVSVDDPSYLVTVNAALAKGRELLALKPISAARLAARLYDQAPEGSAARAHALEFYRTASQRAAQTSPLRAFAHVEHIRQNHAATDPLYQVALGTEEAMRSRTSTAPTSAQRPTRRPGSHARYMARFSTLAAS